MADIRYLTGDATRPEKTHSETVVIAHVVNDEGKWGRGFVVALSRWDDTPERWYHRWHRNEGVTTIPFELGHNLLVPYGPTVDRLWVANMVAQRGWRRGGNDPQALDPEALKTCLRGLYRELVEPFGRPIARVVMPRIGCGLGGAKWSDVEPIIRQELTDRGVDVTVYSMPGEVWDEEKNKA